MPSWDREMWKVAKRIAAAWSPTRLPEPGFSAAALQRLLQLRQRCDEARRRDWRIAEIRVRGRLRRQIAGILSSLQDFVAETESVPTAPLASVGDVYRDLVALQTEFTDVTVDEDEKTVAVTTDRIVLEGVDLGPFQIVWHWEQRDHRHALRVIAEEPQPAGGREDVTHPHVSDETLCTGAADAPLQQALASGRIGDAFLIVRQVLRTYNSRSAYVCLDDWNAGRCAACGDAVPNEDLSCCAMCATDLCDGCRTTCRECDEACCRGCTATCPVCNDPVCIRCRPLVDGRRIALCPTCHAEENEDAEETNDAEESFTEPEPAVAVQPDCLGEAAVPV